MNKVMVTGIAVGKKVGICEVCNFDMEWLLRFPSVLVWADKILVPDIIWESVMKGDYPDKEKYPELNRTVRLVFEMALGEGVIENIEPKEIVTEEVVESIHKQVEKDRERLAELFPESIRLGNEEEVPGQIFIHGSEYCSPNISAIYANLILARAYDAQCLFGDRTLEYCKYKFGLSGVTKETGVEKVAAFNSVFNAYLPNDSLLPEYVTVNKELCSKCSRDDNCRDGYLGDVEKNVKSLFKLREYDEIQQIKEVTNKIIKRRDKAGGVLDAREVLSDFQEEGDRLRKRVRRVFPKVNRWANIATILSIPVAFAGAVAGSPLFIAGMGVAGLSQGAKQVVELLSSKYSWIGFNSRETNVK